MKKPQRHYLDYLRDIVDAAEKAERFVSGTDFDSFRANEQKVFAVVRALEIIGEAANNIPAAVRGRHVEVPWRQIITMRHKVIPHYYGIDVAVVWQTVREELGPMRASVAKVIATLERESK